MAWLSQMAIAKIQRDRMNCMNINDYKIIVEGSGGVQALLIGRVAKLNSDPQAFE
jgi:hypothetical protein